MQTGVHVIQRDHLNQFSDDVQFSTDWIGIIDLIRMIDGLMGGSPADHPERYRIGSPVETVPVNVPQRLVNGGRDPFWTSIALRYVEAAKAAGADIRVIDAPESGHFEMIDPDSTTWPLVRDAALDLLENTPSPGDAPDRVNRGGGWSLSAAHARSEYRGGWPSGTRYPFLGFRPAASLPD